MTATVIIRSKNIVSTTPTPLPHHPYLPCLARKVVNAFQQFCGRRVFFGGGGGGLIHVIILIRRVMHMWNYRIQYSK